MIWLIIVSFIVLYFGIHYAISFTEKTIIAYAKVVDSVFEEKDKKIENLEDRLNDMQSRLETLEDKFERKNKNYNSSI